MKKRKRAALILMAAMMIIAMMPFNAFASEIQGNDKQVIFSDTDGTWCGEYASICYKAGLMEGVGDKLFKPDENLTNAESIVIAARLYNTLKGKGATLEAAKEGETWYQPAYDLLVKEGVLAGPGDNSGELPHFDITSADKYYGRVIFVTFLCSVLRACKTEMPEINQIKLIPDISETDEIEPSILNLYNAGILTGFDKYGSFNAAGLLSRGQVAAIMARIITPSLRKSFTVESFDLCRDVLGLSPDTVLFYTDGEAVTAELFGSTLIGSLVQWGEFTTIEARDDSVQIWVNYTASYYSLAKKIGVSLDTSQAVNAEQSAKAEEGYLGMSEAAILHQKYKSNLGSLLDKYYYEHYHFKIAQSTYHSALSDCAKNMKIEFTDSFYNLDLNAIFKRAKNSPYGYWFN